MMSDQQVVGVVSVNSISYVKTLFDCYQSNKVVVLLRSEDDARIDLLGVTEVISPDATKGWFSEHYDFSVDDRLAQIAFTSGTEGEPKGVLLTHQALSDVTERLNLVMEVNNQIREYVGVPANFSFGLGRFRAVSLAGGACFLPQNGFNPLEIREMLSNDEINAVSAVPSLWRVLLNHKHIFSTEAERLRWIEIGSQYMSQAEKQELRTLFPNAIIAQHYGLTEASRSTFLRIDKLSGPVLESVGCAYGKTEFKLTDSGRIAIKGPHVAKTLLIQGEYVDNLDAQGWFITSDLGEIKDGYLFYKGRADDLINCGGIKLSPDALERDFREKLGIKEGIAIASVADELMGNAVLLSVLNSLNLETRQLQEAMHQVLLGYGVNNRRALKIQWVDQFPLTSTNKVQRKILAEQYLQTEQQKSSSDPAPLGTLQQTASTIGLSAVELEILSIWKQILKTDHIDPDDNFYDIGGDSLSALSALIEMERQGVPSDISRGLLQGLTIREIAQRMTQVDGADGSRHQIRGQSVKNSLSINIVRGFMVLLVVIAHWHQGVLERLPINDPQAVTNFFGPLLAMGTPGFAIIYGVGAGYALYPLFHTDPDRLKGILKKTFSLLLSGILIMGFVFFWEKLRQGIDITLTDFANSFYSVLTYYLLVTASIYPVFYLLSRFRFEVIGALMMALLAYLLDLIVFKPMGLLQTEGIAEFVKLLFSAKYAYFQMLSGSLLGMAVGLTMFRCKQTFSDLSYLFPVGAVLLLLGIVLSIHQTGVDNWFVWPVSTNFIWRWVSYAGFIMILIALTEWSLGYYDKLKPVYRLGFQLLAVTGMLAFPIFVLHELVIPLKTILASYGSIDLFSIAVPIVLIGGICVYLYRSLYVSSFK
ncbi:AMP-binding protein [Nitrincola iocasae]|uniref:AMP-binding protein n=1 Tax=Nitrincola iocasae TaxID=2614693 RepID=A0A5J6LCT9_9GAMM|nr:AMP-binding protein [Nitrincola iocasae]QEW06246.1 AMP-binding protein [Nitrincola iocasae]